MSEQRVVALVTGGARRIGAAIVLDLAHRGYAVAIHCRGSRRAADGLADSVVREGGAADVFAADLSDIDDASALPARVAESMGPVQILVNNASVFESDEAAAPDWEVWERHFALHVKAPVLLASKVAALLPPGSPGLIVNMIDQRVWKPTPHFFSYALSKSALLAATRTMAQAYAPRIRVNGIGPGPTLANERQREEDFAAQVNGLLLGRGPQLTDFGRTIHYLWETPSITGQMIAIDGGQHLAWQTPDVTGMRE